MLVDDREEVARHLCLPHANVDADQFAGDRIRDFDELDALPRLAPLAQLGQAVGGQRAPDRIAVLSLNAG